MLERELDGTCQRASERETKAKPYNDAEGVLERAKDRDGDE